MPRPEAVEKPSQIRVATGCDPAAIAKAPESAVAAKLGILPIIASMASDHKISHMPLRAHAAIVILRRHD